MEVRTNLGKFWEGQVQSGQKVPFQDQASPTITRGPPISHWQAILDCCVAVQQRHSGHSIIGPLVMILVTTRSYSEIWRMVGRGRPLRTKLKNFETARCFSEQKSFLRVRTYYCVSVWCHLRFESL
jgi:hypothetical protein